MDAVCKQNYLTTIVWDVDDVLNNLTYEWFSKYKQEHKCPLDYMDLKENPPHTLLEISRQDYLKSLDSFREQYFSSLEPDKELLCWFEEYGNRFRHVALTATPLHFAEKSANWVIHHFGKWIRSFNFVPSPRTGIFYPDYDQDKGQFLNWLGCADIFIDDNESNIESAGCCGVRSFLFPAPWNKSFKTNKKEFIQSVLTEKICGVKND